MLPASIVPRVLLTGVVCAGMYACSSETVANPPSPSKADASSTVTDAGSSSDAAVSDGGTLDANVDKAAGCASTFGSALTNAFGRVDGTVVAVIPPGEMRCVAPNSTHLVVQVRFGGDVYRMVIALRSNIGDPVIRYGRTSHALIGPPFDAGWYPGLSVDYVNDLGLHANQSPFAGVALDALWPQIANEINVGDEISFYASSSGGSTAGSAHLTHRNGSNRDGAIVLNPRSATPTWLVFHFADQTF